MRRAVGATLLILGLGGGHLLAPVLDRSTPSPLVRPASPEPAVIASAPTPSRAVPHAYTRDPLAFLSTAPVDSLAMLPGIGSVLAGRLVAARTARGPFRTWMDVDRVTGIGPRTIERLRSAAVPE